MEKIPTNEQEQLVEELSHYLKNNNLKGGDLRTAYLLSLEVPAEEIGYEVTEEIEELSKELSTLFDRGLVLNRVVDLIASQEAYDNSVEDYNTMVDELPLTDREKKVLISIVEKQRQGVLVILLDKTSTKVDEIDLQDSKALPQEDLAIKLTRFLSRLQGFKGLAIEFST